MTIRIQLVDDHAITRIGVKAVLQNEKQMNVVAEVDSGHAAVAQALLQQPDVIIMDINMPGLNGIDAARQILARNADIRIIALSMFSERRYVMSMLKTGALGYLLKNHADAEIIPAIHAVIAGRRYLSQPIADMVLRDFTMGRSIDQPGENGMLTAREREVLQLIAEGRRSAQIAGHLRVSEKTVSTHRRKIMTKLDIHSIAGLTKFAIREGLTGLDG